MGSVGWCVALMLRLPILILTSIYLDPLASGLVGALCAGLFEEYVRFFFARQFIKNKIIDGKVASLGVGWGLSDAFLGYALSMVILWIIITYSIDIPNFTVPSTENYLYLALLVR